jgi:hypothetical protein
MKTPSRILFALLLFSVATVTAEEKQASIALPAEFELPSPPVADAENGILLFLKQFGVPPYGAQTMRYSDSLKALKAGKPLPDPQFLDEFRRTYDLGKQQLKPPLLFPGYVFPYSRTAPLRRLFWATEILALHAILEGDRKSADRYLTDALSWSKLLRNAHPTSYEAQIWQYGWQSSIDILLEDWQGHQNQREGFDELLLIFEANRIEIEQLVAIDKADVRWWANLGGCRGLLHQIEKNPTLGWNLNERFKDVTLAELLSLPYDPEADLKRVFDAATGQIRALRQGIPAVKWPGLTRPVVDRTIDDYRKLPNGLGDLMFEQPRNSKIEPRCDHLCRQRLLDACLLWLKRERNGLDVTAASFKDLTDPISGEPLDIDLERRVIRCRGWDGKAAPLKPEELKPGFHDEEDDYLFVVPRWKERK